MTKKYALLLLVFFSAVLFAISGKYTGSTTNAAYRTSINGSSSARVARWEIGEIEKAGVGVTMAAGMAKLESGDSGNWFFEVSNSSETHAHIDDDVKITVKLVSEVFSTGAYNTAESYKWDYIKSGGKTKENPITFKVYCYDQISFEDLVKYKKGSEQPISYTDFMELSEVERANYKEVMTVDTPPIIDTSLNSGATSISTLKLQTEVDGDKLVHFLSQTITIDKEAFAEFGLGDSAKPKVFRIEWDITDETSSGSGEEIKYKVYSSYESASINTYKEYELFEYLKYLSSIKGEPSFIFTSNSGGQVEIKASKLTAEQKASLEEFERQNIVEWERFKQDYNEYLESLGYLEAGLSCSFIFDVKVAQGD